MRLLILPDLHIPHHDAPLIQEIARFNRSHFKATHILFLGDVLDFEYISRFSEKDVKARFSSTVPRDMATLATIVAAFKPAKAVLLEGNHEHRLNTLLAQYPSLGMDLAAYLKYCHVPIDKLVWSWSRGEVWEAGPYTFVHGLYHGVNHARRMLEAYGRTIIYGHTHDMASFTAYHLPGAEPHFAQSCGCLCRYDLAYMRGQPSRWQHGFAMATITKHPSFHVVRGRPFKALPFAVSSR